MRQLPAYLPHSHRTLQAMHGVAAPHTSALVSPALPPMDRHVPATDKIMGRQVLTHILASNQAPSN